MQGQVVGAAPRFEPEGGVLSPGAHPAAPRAQPFGVLMETALLNM